MNKKLDNNSFANVRSRSPSLLFENDKVHILVHEDEVQVYPYGVSNRRMIVLPVAVYKQFIFDEYARIEEEDMEREE